ncbi:MAG: P1 family peptidase [Pseudomonadota bacterium]
MRAGTRNLITDISGLRVGNASDEDLKSGTTVLTCERPMTAAVHVMGGAPGTRETDLLSPENTVEVVDALVLSGGSAFGLDAVGGVQSGLREAGRGFAVGDQHIPIVPGAILFDLINGGNKDWGLHSPYRDLGYAAFQSAACDFELGSIGAGTGALIAGLKGGLGSASCEMSDGTKVGALVAVNALGAATIADGPEFWASPFEIGTEFGGLGAPSATPEDADDIRIKFRHAQNPGQNTTIGIIATNAKLTKAQAKRLAVVAHDGFARAIWPSHTPLDGDLIFSVATGELEREPTMDQWIDLSAVAASTMARAIARGTYHATPQENDLMPCWQQKFGASTS